LVLRQIRIEALRGQFVAHVPAGSRVHFNVNIHDAEWHQHLVEFAAIAGAYVVTDIQQANYNVYVVEAPDAMPAGFRLMAEKVRRG
jgi:hypothetical protein